MTITNAHRQKLDEQGFVLLPELIGIDEVEEFVELLEEVYLREGEAAGSEFKQELGCRRLANLVNKGDRFGELIVDERVLPLVNHVLQNSVKLSSLNARSAEPSVSATQPLHADMAAIRDAFGNWVCNVVWMLDDFTSDNGTLRIVPKSHQFDQLPQDAMGDPTANHPDEVNVTAKRGSVLILNAHTWHGGTANKTNQPRRAIHAFYCRRDKPQQQYQKRMLAADVQQRLSNELREILALDDAENDRLSSHVAIRSGFLK
ncbi:MAG: ectoine hydroxylase-related dioxygenase (phytanoyl-CoA dioxygenase family) [Pirellulaceae bacterium]|jgi:ectoine hydroxylase-related dioxygenase (phytanoyl-CoA dioxygenase family)